MLTLAPMPIDKFVLSLSSGAEEVDVLLFYVLASPLATDKPDQPSNRTRVTMKIPVHFMVPVYHSNQLKLR